MCTIPYWIQRADFTATEHDPIDSVSAVELLNVHDWRSEWRLLREREAAGLETCPPGVGFTAAPGRILHVCPGDDGRALVHYHFAEPRRWLGFIPGGANIVQTNSAVLSAQVPEFVRRFYDDDHAWLIERTAAV
jgi:hypothetical protein